jgi:site-specific recombinase XerD
MVPGTHINTNPMDLQKAIDLFLQAKRADGRKERTLADYRRVFKRYVKHVDHNLETWTRDSIRAYVVYLRDRGWKPGTVGLHIRYLRAFWHWLYVEGYTDQDFAQAVAAPKQHIREESLLTLEEFKALVQACAGDRWARRDRAIILMLADTGMRRSEIMSLQRDQVVFEGDEAWVLLTGDMTKNSKERYVFLGSASTAALRAYLDERADDAPDLWRSERGPLGGDGLWYMLRRRAKIAGLDPKRIHPHLLRKVFATWWIENGGDEQRLMRIGGWSGPEMLRIYVRLGSRIKLQEAHRQYGPVDNLFENGE